jgi:protein-disulfide isomerase
MTQISRAALAACAALALPLAACQKQPQDEFGQKVRAYLLEHPEVIEEAVVKLQQNKQAQAQETAKASLAKFRQQLERDPRDFVANPDGKITVVEFFDYRCGYCKRVHDTVQNVLKSDGNIRFVYKEFPVLGPESMFASRAAIAAFKIAPDKYVALHNRLMALSTRAVNEETVMAEVKAVGLKPEAVRQKMQDPSVLKEIERNQELAESLRIRGTPSFVVGDILIPGATDEESLKQAVATARGRIPARTK